MKTNTFNTQELKGLPVAVVSAVGSRSGKSFLLFFMMKYLEELTSTRQQEE